MSIAINLYGFNLYINKTGLAPFFSPNSVKCVNLFFSSNSSMVSVYPTINTFPLYSPW